MTETELTEVIMHLAVYAGWPRAMSAVMVAKELFGS
jgi:4-carboxymuconolactone decarboxylase